VLAEQSDEWTEGRRCMSLELLAKSRIRIVNTEPTPTAEPAVTTQPLTAQKSPRRSRGAILYTTSADVAEGGGSVARRQVLVE
jgi:hypothetical protein